MRTSKRNRTHLMAVLTPALAALLSACGGGGGGGNPPPAPPPPPVTFTVGGNVTGLTGTGLVLRNNGGNDLAVNANGAFTFSAPLTAGSAYEVTVLAQPLNQTCVFGRSSGTVTANVTDVGIFCITNEYSIGGTISGLVGRGLVLQLNGANDFALGGYAMSFYFPRTLVNGDAYAITVLTQPVNPSQTCTVANGSGTVALSHVSSVVLNCITHTHSISGAVNGLLGTGLVLRNNGGDPLPINSNGAFSFPAPVASSAAYNVLASVHPLAPAQECSPTRGSGVVVDAPITNVSIDCHVMGKFLFATSNSLPGTITGAAIDQSTGVLAAIPGVPVTTGAGANGPTITPDGRKLYVANHDALTISGYRVDPATGALTAVPNSPFAAGRPVDPPTVDPSGRFLYTTDQANPRVLGFSIDGTTGALTSIAGSPFATTATTISVRVEPTGRFAYVVTRVVPTDALSLATFAIDAGTGALTPIGSPLPVGTSMPPGGRIAVSADGSSLFVSLGPPDVIHGFTLNTTTGAPTAMPGSPFANAGFPRVFPHPKLSVIYVAATDSIRGYAVGATLTGLPGSPYVASISGLPPPSIVFDPGARFLYAAILGSTNRVTPFAIKDDGSLEQVANGTVVLPFRRALSSPIRAAVSCSLRTTRQERFSRSR